MRDCIVITADDVWIKVRDAFVHLGHVQQNRASICTCSRPAGDCEACNRSLDEVLAGGDTLLTAVTCGSCGQQYPYIDAPQICTASPEAGANPPDAAEAVTPRRT